MGLYPHPSFNVVKLDKENAMKEDDHDHEKHERPERPERPEGPSCPPNPGSNRPVG